MYRQRHAYISISIDINIHKNEKFCFLQKLGNVPCSPISERETFSVYRTDLALGKWFGGQGYQVFRGVFSRVYFPLFPTNSHLIISLFTFVTSTVYEEPFLFTILILITASCANYVSSKHSLQSYPRPFESSKAGLKMKFSILLV